MTLRRVSALALLTGLHARCGSPSLLAILQTSSLFDKQVLRWIFRLAVSTREPCFLSLATPFPHQLLLSLNQEELAFFESWKKTCDSKTAIYLTQNMAIRELNFTSDEELQLKKFKAVFQHLVRVKIVERTPDGAAFVERLLKGQRSRTQDTEEGNEQDFFE